MNDYNTHNLRYNASFSQSLYSGVRWVPVNILGKTRYTNKQMEDICSLLPEEKYLKINYLYEAIQLIQCGNFNSAEDNKSIHYKNINWALHTCGYKAVENNEGCCAAIANWLYYILKDKYEEIGILSILADSGRGHAVNYIRNCGNLYIVDLSAFIVENKCFVQPETGDLKDFLKNKIVTAGLFQVESFSAFCSFFSTYVGRMKGRTFLFCQHNGEIQWEGYRTLENGKIETFWPEGFMCVVENSPNIVVRMLRELPFNIGEGSEVNNEK